MCDNRDGVIIGKILSFFFKNDFKLHQSTALGASNSDIWNFCKANFFYIYRRCHYFLLLYNKLKFMFKPGLCSVRFITTMSLRLNLLVYLRLRLYVLQFSLWTFKICYLDSFLCVILTIIDKVKLCFRLKRSLILTLFCNINLVLNNYSKGVVLLLLWKVEVITS